jgi:hypothetical protein
LEKQTGKFFRKITAKMHHSDAKRNKFVLVNPKVSSTKHAVVDKWYWGTDNYYYVVIVRDPRANLVSYRYWSNRSNLNDKKALDKHIRYIRKLWNDLNGDEYHRNQTYLIQYEYALTQPNQLVKDLSYWIGMPLESSEEVKRAVDRCSASTMRKIEANGKLHGESHLTKTQREMLRSGNLNKSSVVTIPVKVRAASVDAWKKDTVFVTDEDRRFWKKYLSESEDYPSLLKQSYVGDEKNNIPSSYDTGNSFFNLQALV